jgi:hypothetical protein
MSGSSCSTPPPQGAGPYDYGSPSMPMHARPPAGIPYWFLEWAQLHINPPAGKFATALYTQATFGPSSFLHKLREMLLLQLHSQAQDPEVERTLRIAIRAAEACRLHHGGGLTDCFFQRFAELQAAASSA